MSRISKTVLSATFLLAKQVVADTCVTTIAGTGDANFADGPALSAKFNIPSAVFPDKSGNILISDMYGNRIRKLTLSGSVSTIAGSGAKSAQDGSAQSSSFNYPQGITIDSSGNIYISDSANNKIRRLTTNDNVTSFVGSGQSDFVDAIGTNAAFSYPIGLVLDSIGNLFVADSYNRCIRKVTTTGAVTTLAGNGTFGSVDGLGTTATFGFPVELAIDASNNIYVADNANHNIRKITPSGVVTTVAGSIYGFEDGPVSSAKFRYPNGIAVDTDGTIYVADTGNTRIRMIKNGFVSTIAGTGSQIIVTDDGPGSKAVFTNPISVKLDLQGNLIVADGVGGRIRKISMNDCYPRPSTSVTSIVSSTTSVSSTTKSTILPSSTPNVISGGANDAHSTHMHPLSTFSIICSFVVIALSILVV